ncbi:MAG: glycosyltransferase family 2 protein [Chloroflexi bacterium]|nr:glycosyltransferase family 2 protein [Chloroflexota bacterium]
MKNHPLVALLVPVHNGWEDTREFLDSLRRVSYPNFKTIIVDDGSTDDTAEMLAADYPEVIVIKGDGNLWWSRSVNIAIEKALKLEADYVLQVDNDTAVDREFISTLVETAQENPNAIITSKSYWYGQPDRVWFGGGEIAWLRGGLKQTGCGDIDRGQFNEQSDSQWASIGFLIPIPLFAELGMIDARSFPQYWADADFTYRAYKKGHRVILEPRSLLWHKVSSSVRHRMPQRAPWAQLLYFLTHVRSRYNLKAASYFYWRHCPKALLPYALGRFYFPLLRGFLVRLLFFWYKPWYRRPWGL